MPADRAAEETARRARRLDSSAHLFRPARPAPFPAPPRWWPWPRERDCSLGHIALAYESALLGLPEEAILAEMQRRFQVMQAAVQRGLEDDLPSMQLLQPSARQVFQAEAAGSVPIGGLHTRAAARAMAVMHVNGGMGVVCAAPTAGAAGVIPGVMVTLAEERSLSQEQISLALLAASAVGLVVAHPGHLCRRGGRLPGRDRRRRGHGGSRRRRGRRGHRTPGSRRRGHRLSEHHGLRLRPGAGHRRDPLPHPQRRGGLRAFVCADLILGGYATPSPWTKPSTPCTPWARCCPANSIHGPGRAGAGAFSAGDAPPEVTQPRIR